MSDVSHIQWTDSTWNVATGCTKVSDGCTHCYIERTPPFRMNDRRFDKPGIGGTTGVVLHPDRLEMPLRWRKPRRVFVNSLADLFHEDIPDAFVAQTFAVMAAAPQHEFQVLTKRHARMRSLLSSVTFVEIVKREFLDLTVTRYPKLAKDQWSYPLPNCWLGVSCENQQWADARIPALLETPAAVRFLSCEPLLGSVDLSRYLGGVYGRAIESRGRGVPSGRDGRIDDRRRGESLEGGGSSRKPLDWRDPLDSVRSPQGGEFSSEVFPGPSNDRLETCICASTQAGVEALLWTDSSRVDNQPQEWSSYRQSPRQPGAGDPAGAGEACPRCAETGPARPIWHTQRDGQIDNCGGSGDLLPASIGGAAAGDCSRLRRRDAGDLQDCSRRTAISWLIAGGESGLRARPMDPQWVRSLVAQCRAAGAAPFVKQLGSVWAREHGADSKGGDWDYWPEDLRVREYPQPTAVIA